jgi:hypothetical protein
VATFVIYSRNLTVAYPGGVWTATGRVVKISDPADPRVEILRNHPEVAEIADTEAARGWPIGFGADHSGKERNDALLPEIKGKTVAIVGRGASAEAFEARYAHAVKIAVNPGAWPDKGDGGLAHVTRRLPAEHVDACVAFEANYFK